MSRCDYDTIFQRVFCVTLVAIALTFTVILTNVFVDIDGLLSSKDKLKPYDAPIPVLESEVREVKVANLIRPDEFYKGHKSFEENREESYRNKRSIESSSNFLFHVKNPKLKSILSNRLNSLLEELDAEENMADTKSPNDDAEKLKDKKSKAYDEDTKKIGVPTATEKIDEEDLLHLAMHNILLQGIIGHMDLNDVYKKVHSLVEDFKDINEVDSSKDKTEKQDQDTKKQSGKGPFVRAEKEFEIPVKMQKESKSNIVHNPSLEEGKMFEELIKCDKLQNDINNNNQIKNTKGPKETKSVVTKGPKLLIKTIIDITSNKNNKRRDSNANSKETIKGIVKLIYNGKTIRLSRIEEDDKQLTENNFKDPTESAIDNGNEKIKDIDVPEKIEEVIRKPERKRNSNAFFNKIIDDYFKKYPKRYNEDQIDNVNSKRLKRHIKIRYNDDSFTTKRPKPKRDEDDDELFVEIETHFDSKGLRGDKKKKLIRNIIEKIQKVIHANIDQFEVGKKKKHKHMQVKKRNLNPLDKDKKLLINKMILPFQTIDQRHSDPISKVVPLPNPMPEVFDKFGETWKRENYGPGFLTVSKSLNSAEMGEIDVDYNKVIPANGIPQRLQKPLNTDVSEEMLNANTYFDLGNLKFFIKEIDGTGLSIGFNQYTDEAPDPESIKLFTGIEHLVKNFHQNEGTENTPTNQEDGTRSMSEEHDREHILSKRNVIGSTDEHVLIRRSVKETHEKDYHSNEYKVIFNNDFLPYKSYQEIYEDKKNRVAYTINKETENSYDRGLDDVEIVKKKIKIKELPALMDDNNNIFYKKLKPSEILSIASLLDRKKRSPNMQKITNLNKKLKVNKYLNTRVMGRKKIILKKNRNKRQVNKIRIIATDVNQPRHPHAHSEENIFLVGDENLLADRAIIHDVQTPEVNYVDDKHIGEQYDMIPVLYEEPPYSTHVFEGRSRHNQLMSKYPHIFLEEISRSKEEYDPTFISDSERKSANYNVQDVSAMVTEKAIKENPDVSVPKLEDFVDVTNPNDNYKLTVKIFPKNVTGVNSGFKEVHASINKSYNKDGLRYSSLVNVSEISRVENLNNKTTTTPTPPVTKQSILLKHIQDQQSRMDNLLKQHKKRIDEQLDHLKKERVAVRTLQKRVIEHSSLKPEQMIPMITDDLNKLVASALMQMQTKTETVTTTTVAPTTESTTKANDNINNEILNQINKNTQMLQTFLQKLTEKLSESDQTRRKNDEAQKFHFNSRIWKPFQENETKNTSHVPIPFVYGFNSPYNSLNHQIPHIPVASVVYHGHIHTNCNRDSDPQCKEVVDVKNQNRTKYFLDDMEDFKVQHQVKIENTPLDVETTASSTTKA